MAGAEATQEKKPQDLEYHKFTGQGEEAKYKSQSNWDERKGKTQHLHYNHDSKKMNFQNNIIRAKRAKYDNEIQVLEQEKQEWKQYLQSQDLTQDGSREAAVQARLDENIQNPANDLELAQTMHQISAKNRDSLNLNEHIVGKRQMELYRPDLMQARISRMTPEEIDQRIEYLQEKKEKVVFDVLSGDVLSIARKGFDHDVNALYINNRLYIDDDEDGSFTSYSYQQGDRSNARLNGMFEMEDADYQLEEEKVLNQLRNREIFKYVNSDNLMEYMAYNEKQGQFSLEEKDLPDLDWMALESQILDIIGQVKNLPRDSSPIWETWDTMLQDMLKTVTNAKFSVQADQKKGDSLVKLQELAKSAKNLRSQALGHVSGKDLPPVTGFWDLVGRTMSNAMYQIAPNVGELIQYAVSKIDGVQEFKDAKHASETGDSSVTEGAPFKIYGGILSILSPISKGIECVSKSAMESADVIYKRVSSWDALTSDIKIAKIEWLTNKASISPVAAIAAGISIGKGIVTAEEHRHQKNQAQAAQKSFLEKKQTRFARVANDVAVENAIQQYENGVDAAMGFVNLGMSMFGVGGLLVSVPTALVSIAIKKIGTAIQRSQNKSDVLNAPDVLGGIHYNQDMIDSQYTAENKTISHNHMNKMLRIVTGITDTDALFDMIKVVDSIDIHRAMRASADSPKPNPYVVKEMQTMGYADPKAYHKISLEDIQKKIGYQGGEWRAAIRNATTDIGVDRESFWSTIKKAFGGSYKERQSFDQIVSERHEKARASKKK